MNIQELRAGDLLFMYGISDMSQAIQKATGQYSHVAIYFDSMLYHATKDKGVIKQQLREFLKTKQHRIFVYRYPRIKAYYCSQYIADILPIFETIPMQFGDDKHTISEFWQQYYDELGVAVPLNQSGTNPSQLAQSENLQYLGELHD